MAISLVGLCVVEPQARGRPIRRRLLLLGLASLVTVLNAVKPLYIDDPYYYDRANYIAQHPLDPSGFEWFWYQWPQPSKEDNAPALFLYWTAAAIRAFGHNPLAWKLSLLPLVLLFVWGVRSLLERFAAPVETPLLIMTVLSPVFLPSWNLMLDVPMMALVLGALVVFMRASDRRSRPLAILAGLLAALAMQTKYVGAIAPVLILAWGFLFGTGWLALTAATVAAIAFGSWEVILWSLYGESQFLWNLVQSFPERWTRGQLARALLPTLGGTGVCTVLVVLTGLGMPLRVVLASGITILVGFALVAIWPVEFGVLSAFGAALALAILVALTRLWLAGEPSGPDRRRENLFLLGWLALEVVEYFVISPFGAVRRVMGMTIVATLVAGRLAAPLGDRLRPRRTLYLAAALNVALGLGYWALDLREAQVARSAPRDAARRIRELDPGAVIGYVGHWGFGHYANEVGMRPVVPDHTLLRRGDWLVHPDRIDKQEILVSGEPLEPVETLVYDDGVPLQTMVNFYMGSVPLAHREQPRLRVQLLRATADVVLPTAWEPAILAQYALNRRSWDSVVRAVPALVHHLEEGRPAERRFMAEVLGALGPRAEGAVPALTRHLEDPARRVRIASVRALGSIGPPARAALPRLRALLEDEDRALRREAREAIGAISGASEGPGG